MTLADLDLNKVYSYADYFKWRFADRVELIKGHIFKMSPAPSRVHQEVLGSLHLKLGNFLIDKPCQVYMAPFDVRLPRKSKKDEDIITVLQPDICVVCNPAKLDDRGCIGAPDIVVEILSPGNNAKELKNKFEIYEQSGVLEYWVISPQNNTFLINTLVNGKYVTSRPLVQGDVVTTPILPGFSINVGDMFASIG